ncbi:MAG: hypothetical protein SGJ19_06515, partial [Planctomycetia bacterium]|nr:hypothetical protein [Planctomycetia bacterium]
MIHAAETMTQIGTHRRGVPIYQCPECGAKIVAIYPPAGECRKSPRPVVMNLDCIHRLEKVATVPCGVCPQTNKQTFAGVYLC